jgi:hypothetical protein
VNVDRGSSARRRAVHRAGRLALVAGFVFLSFFFGGLAGAGIGLALVLLRATGARASLFWGLGLSALVAAGLSVLVQGLPSGVATPAFGPHHWVAHLLVGCALASLTMAALIELLSVAPREAALEQTVSAPEELPRPAAATTADGAARA